MFWDFVIAINFFISSVGLTANFVFFRLVVFNKAYDAYCRISAFIVSFGMTSIIASNVTSVIMCLSYGSYFETGPCTLTDAHMAMLYLHSCGEFSIAAGIFILVFERYASVFLPTFRASGVYKLWFLVILTLFITTLLTYLYLVVTVRSMFSVLIAFSCLSALFVVSFLLVMYLLFAAKEKYYKTLGLISLSKRFMLAESYQLCKSALPATLVSLAINNLLCFSAWSVFLDYLSRELIYEYFVFANMTNNLDATLFPILFLYGSKKIRAKLSGMSLFHGKATTAPLGVRQLDGHRINVIQSQNDYFEQLNHAWA